jgi:uncharacterized protein YigE (DUF2233 family)
MKIYATVASLFLCLLLQGRAVEFSVAEIAGKKATVCRVDLSKEKLRLFLRDDTGRSLKTFGDIQSWLQPQNQRLVFAMNAGMYHGDFSPVGLFVSDGKELSPLNTGSAFGNFFLKPNGVFAITEKGAQVVETSEYPKLKSRVILASQSGPMLLRKGVIHPVFKPDSSSRLYRNGVGVPTPRVALFVITEAPVNLYEFALLFRDVLHCPDALYFDGTVSSLYAPTLQRNDRRMDLGPIVGVTE